ncbi:mitochondrial RNA pseudouridine synthase Rpusd4-like [Dendronephthya gigantea]|uniref:mitochondrial RNA pseudouridine synthase Rpusd4-like n=1 Tax=Dendronephthya gigantea TaxID=151771 RepID=UPI001069A18B|nr:mitochondrial RNA pseudouridine synthase Rpusd4-like [Dendronephthya gigantea]
MKPSLAIRRNKILQGLLKSVIYNKHDIIAINKPYGLTVQGNSNTPISLTEMLDDFANAKGLKNRPRLAHRLDRDSTGVLLLAKSEGAAQYLGEVFRERKVKKTYWSVVVGSPNEEEGHIRIPLKEQTVNGRFKITLSEEEISDEYDTDCKPAHTRYKVLAKNRNTCSLLELQPVTGYKHQIRVHLAQGLGTPVLGDHKYSSEKQQPQVIPLRLLQMLGFSGVPNTQSGKRKIQAWQRALIPLHLHAKEIMLDDLETKPVIIRAPLPEFFTETLSSLKLDPLQNKQKKSKAERRYRDLKQLGISTNIISGF